MTEQLQRKVDRAVKLIQSAGKIASEHGQPLEICYSGGKDSDVILELAKMAGVNMRPIYKNTTIDPPGTINHVKKMGIEIVRPKESFFQIMERKGWPSRLVRFCCSELKEYKILDYAVVGIRADESQKRKERYKEPELCRVYNSKDKVRQYLPILDWSLSDVTQFIEERGIKCAPLYYDECGKFYPDRRLGCMCCPLASKNKRILEFKARPNMVKAYIRAGSKYRYNDEMIKNRRYFRDIYEWFTCYLFCESIAEFRERFGKNLFDDGIECKLFLEQYFNIKL